MKAKAGDVFCVYNERLKKYTALQITKLFIENDKELAALLVLDKVENEILKKDELTDLKPLALNFMFWNKDKYLINVSPEVPKGYIWVGNIPPITDEDTNSYSNWDDGYSIYRQMLWNEIPEEKRFLFKNAMKTNDDICVNIGEHSVRLNTRVLSDSKYDFESAKQLAALTCLYDLILTKRHIDLFEYLESNPFVLQLTLKGHNQKVLDFRKSHLLKLNVDITGVDEIFLNDNLEELHLSGQFSDNFKISAKDDGAELLIGYQKTIINIPGIKNLVKLHCIGTEEADLSQIIKVYPALTELRLWGKPGFIRNFNQIKFFKHLSCFTTSDMFGFAANEIPKPDEMPHLSWFWMSSLPEDAAKEAKRLYKNEVKNGLDLWISKARKSEWLAENLENPFRSWDVQENISIAIAKKAAARYKKTRSEILNLISDLNSNFEQGIMSAVNDYTVAFNQMDKKKGFIETEEREDICNALTSLLELIPQETNIDINKVYDVFEKVREF